MERVLFGNFFSRSHSRKMQTAKTQEDKKKGKFGAGAKQTNEVNTSV